MDKSWIKLHRRFLESPVWKYSVDAHYPVLITVFIHLLLSVNWENKKWYDGKKENIIPAGSIITSINHIAINLAISAQTVRTCLQHLENMQMITRTTTNKWTQVWIVNWLKYQMPDNSNNKQTNNPSTNEPQTTNKRLTTTKEYKNIRKKEYIYNIYFLAWLEKFNKLFNSQYKPTKKNNELYNLRRSTFTVEEMERALFALGKPGFYTGDNDTGWKATPEYLLKSDEQVDKFLNMIKGKGVNYERIDPATVKF